MLKKATRTLNEAVRDRAFPGGQLGILTDDESRVIVAGNLSYTPTSFTVTEDTIYDLASVTKIVATTAVAMIFAQQERFGLDDALGEYFADIPDARVARATWRQLLSHSAGLPAWRAFFEEIPEESVGSPSAKRRIFELLRDTASVYEPGTSAIYSDLDMMWIGFLLEKIGGAPLDDLCERFVFEPLGMALCAYRPLDKLPNAFPSPTRRCAWRRRVMVGEADDQNTFAAGGVLAQAGVFANAESLLRFARELLRALTGDGEIFDEETVRAFLSLAFPGGEFSFRLGFDGKSAAGSLLPETFGPNTFGHWGFTGTGLWIDPDRRVAVALLANRVHPDVENDRIQFWRPRIFKAALAEI
ncbi:MAG: beta-lactamase family protein [Deltaproteobacteria bacterium]|nr:beta-lactamase family protein [Deltaproteobacteria bacterium]